MARLILLGTGAAWCGPERENTFLLVRGATTNLLIDVAGSPTQRLAQVGVGPHEIDHVVLTHNHPDHIYGFPIFMLNAWMAGRRAPLHVYGLADTLRSAKALLKAVGFRAWPNLFKIKYHTVVINSEAMLPRIDEFEISARRGKHFVATMGLRVTNHATGKCFAYSADTAPSANIVALARDADYFLHEATQLDESNAGHSSAVEAGQAAHAADVGELILIHVPPEINASKWKRAAKRHFRGKVTVANDFDVIAF